MLVYFCKISLAVINSTLKLHAPASCYFVCNKTVCPSLTILKSKYFILRSHSYLILRYVLVLDFKARVGFLKCGLFNFSQTPYSLCRKVSFLENCTTRKMNRILMKYFKTVIAVTLWRQKWRNTRHIRHATLKLYE